MLPTFVIGLREGLEAALIVGIVAAFLRQRGRRDLLRWVFAGVAASILLCVVVGVLLRVLSQNLPQRQQEGLETVIGLVAVAMVTYMVVWMRRHSRGLKGQLEGAAANALAVGSAWALVAMAFLAVLREGLETVVFLLAAFNESASGASAGIGALLGILVAVALGYGIYRGGVRINLSKFFRVTGVVLVLVAAGLVVNALHTAHEAGWLDIGQQRTVDLSSIVRPGSVQASLLTGMLGLQDHPVVIEVIGWLAYLIPVGLYVAWPPGRKVARGVVAGIALAAGAAAVLATVVLAAAAPSRPRPNAALDGAGLSAAVVSRTGDTAVIRAGGPGAQAPARDLAVRRTGTETRNGLATDVYTVTIPGSYVAASRPPAGLPDVLGVADVARRNGGRLPLGARVTGGDVPVTYTDRDTATFWVDQRTGRVVDLQWHEVVGATAHMSTGPLAIGPMADDVRALPTEDARDAARAARHDAATLDRHDLLVAAAASTGAVAGLLLVLGALFALAARRVDAPPRNVATPASESVRS